MRCYFPIRTPIGSLQTWRAAQIRADHNLRTPDAIHAATALAAGVTGFITNDPVFRRIESLEVLVLDDLLS